jgi:ABC-type phosphate/phosphonate transport system substrate-binding protein
MAGAAAAAIAPAHCLGEDNNSLLHVAISTDTLAGANVSDARAAYAVWIKEVTGHMGTLRAEIVPEIFLPSPQLLAGIRRGSIDCYGITALEYEKVADLTDPNFFLLQDYLADGMEYVLIVHNSSPYRKIGDMRGAQILTHHHRDMVLLPAWMETMLAENNLPPAERFFGSQTARDNVTQVALPVFFRRVDGACLARRSWETAVELNPQLGRDVRTLVVSPKVVPIAICFRRNSSPEGRRALIDAVMKIASIPAGQQIVAMYQAHGFVVRTSAVMKSTVDMVAQYQRLLAQQTSGRKGQP